jgi:glycosyltransferase involved in cell wall biosynthesis
MIKSDLKKSYLHVLPYNPTTRPSGISTVVFNLYKQMEKNSDYKPLVLISDEKFDKPSEHIVNAMTCIYVRLRNPWHIKNKLRHLFSFLFYLPRSIMVLYRFLKKYNVEIINSHSQSHEQLFIFIILRWLKLYKGKIIISMHSAGITYPALDVAKPLGFIEKKVLLIILKNADTIIACSKFVKKDIVKYFPELEENIVVIYNGIDTDTFVKNMDLSFKLPNELINCKIITSIASFSKAKGNELLINAFLHIHERLPTLRLVLIGAHGDQLEKINNLIIERNMTEKVFLFVNLPHNKIHTFLSATDIFILPSHSEAFGIVILEAAHHKLPVIATNVGGIPEIIQHNKTGILIDKGNTEQLVNAIKFMFSNPDLGRSMGKSLHNNLHFFSWKNACEQYIFVAKT